MKECLQFENVPKNQFLGDWLQWDIVTHSKQNKIDFDFDITLTQKKL